MKLKSHRCVQAVLGLVLVTAATWAAAPAEPPQEQKFIRFVEDSEGGGKLQAAVVSFRNPQGVTVHLVSAVHVGETRYYNDLGKTFAGYDVLLYEMIKPRGMDVPVPGQKSDSMVSMFQRFLKDALELDFQLDAIDYRAKNFVHADLDAETFAQLQEERGENIFTLMLRSILTEMQRPQKAPEVSFTELLVALTSPDRARHFKLILAREFEDLEAKVAGLEGPNGSVLVTERNKAAINVLKQQIDKGNKTIGVFYGAAHMPDLSQRVKDLGFQPVKTEWRTAWDMTPREGDVVLKVVKKTPAEQPVIQKKAYYTVDDGQTWFADAMPPEKLPPFTLDGKEAVRAHVYQYGDRGKPFVLYLEKYTPEARNRLANFYADPANKGKIHPDLFEDKSRMIRTPTRPWIMMSYQVMDRILTMPEKDGELPREIFPE
jgi:hypothetical protein